MTDDQALSAEFEARMMARDCPVYAPPQNVDAGEATYHATRSGGRSAACGERWMAARSVLSDRGLTPRPTVQLKAAGVAQ